jgi:hypothetical protein
MDEALVSFIIAHENDDLANLLLKQKDILGHSPSFVVNQINGRRRAKEKLPTWYAHPSVIYPPQQNLEQCSSEATARFKCGVYEKGSTETMADLTGGFGVDSFYFNQIFKKVFHVEPNSELIDLARKNYVLLSHQLVKRIEFIQLTAEEFVASLNQKLDWIYLDPSRKSNGRKVVRLEDSQPDVVALLPQLLAKSDNILIKTSPLLDLKLGIKQLQNVKEVFVVSVGGECKEVLFRLQKGWAAEPAIICVNLLEAEKEEYQFKFSAEISLESAFHEPLSYLYEPNASILKAGAFKSIARTYKLFKMAVNTHLYASDQLNHEFPGRVYKILADIESRKSFLPDGHANIISRNHPLSPEAIRKKFKLKDGGEKYVLAFSGVNKKFLLIAERLK